MNKGIYRKEGKMGKENCLANSCRKQKAELGQGGPGLADSFCSNASWVVVVVDVVVAALHRAFFGSEEHVTLNPNDIILTLVNRALWGPCNLSRNTAELYRGVCPLVVRAVIQVKTLTFLCLMSICWLYCMYDFIKNMISSLRFST